MIATYYGLKVSPSIPIRAVKFDLIRIPKNIETLLSELVNHWFRIVSLQSKSNERFTPVDALRWWMTIFIENGLEEAVTPAEIFNKKRRADIAGELMFQKGRLAGRLIAAVNVMKIPDGPVSFPPLATVHTNPILPNWSGYNFHERGRVLEIHVARNASRERGPCTRQTDTRRKEIGKRLSELHRMMKRIK